MTGLRSFFGRRLSESPAGAPQWIVAGLGNPGPEYARHRHNVGFQILDLFAKRHGLEFDKFQKRARLAIGAVELGDGWRGRVLLAKPMTYMNASGEAIAQLASFYKVAPVAILVVHDDLDLPLGRIRLRPGGSAGGQKGIASTIRSLGTDSFHRLRVGISRPGAANSDAAPGMDPSDYVLQPFTTAQEKEMEFARTRAVEAIERWLSHGIEAAMNAYNGG